MTPDLNEFSGPGPNHGKELFARRLPSGRVDLVHANNSRDAFDSGADRHANLADGQIDPDVIAGIVRDAGSDAIVETPREGHADDIEFLRKMI